MDIQTGLATAVLVPHKGRHKYSVAELKKFIYETGRTYGILQYEKRPALKALATDVAKELKGMSIRATPKKLETNTGIHRQDASDTGRTISDSKTSTSETTLHRGRLEPMHLPWVVKHSQFLLNRFHTHEDDAPPISRDGKETIRNHFANLENCSVSYVRKIKE